MELSLQQRRQQQQQQQQQRVCLEACYLYEIEVAFSIVYHIFTPNTPRKYFSHRPSPDKIFLTPGPRKIFSDKPIRKFFFRTNSKKYFLQNQYEKYFQTPTPKIFFLRAPNQFRNIFSRPDSKRKIFSRSQLQKIFLCDTQVPENISLQASTPNTEDRYVSMWYLWCHDLTEILFSFLGTDQWLTTVCVCISHVSAGSSAGFSRLADRKIGAGQPKPTQTTCDSPVLPALHQPTTVSHSLPAINVEGTCCPL